MRFVAAREVDIVRHDQRSFIDPTTWTDPGILTVMKALPAYFRIQTASGFYNVGMNVNLVL